MKLIRLCLPFAALLMAVPAHAQETAPPPEAAPEKPKDPVVCKRVQQTTTRMGSQRICMTRSQWDQQDRELDNLKRQQMEIRPNAPG